MTEYIEREAVLDLQHRLYHSPLSTVIELSPTYIISPDAVQRIPAADVVARDCYDKILAENDDMRAIIDTYGGIENIQSAFVKLHEIEAADVRPVVLCRDCKHRDPEDKKCDCGGLEHAHMFPVADDWFCADGERKDGDGDA